MLVYFAKFLKFPAFYLLYELRDLLSCRNLLNVRTVYLDCWSFIFVFYRIMT